MSLPKDHNARAPHGHTAERLTAGGARRSWPWLLAAVVSALAIVVAVNTAIYAGIVVARLRGEEARSVHPTIPSIPNLRRADDHLLVGDQPTPAGYRALAAMGVKVVVNLRTGEGPDPLGDDRELLRRLGFEYVWLPVHDGHAPDRRTVERFVGVVDRAPGQVYAHCGGGVGRSSVMEAAYLAAHGKDTGVMEQLRLGPLSLEQAWFVHTVGPGRPTAENRVVQVVSRVIDFPRAYFSWTVRQLR